MGGEKKSETHFCLLWQTPSQLQFFLITLFQLNFFFKICVTYYLNGSLKKSCLQDYEAACDSFTRCLEIDKNQPVALLYFGLSLYHRGNVKVKLVIIMDTDDIIFCPFLVRTFVLLSLMLHLWCYLINKNFTFEVPPYKEKV